MYSGSTGVFQQKQLSRPTRKLHRTPVWKPVLVLHRGRWRVTSSDYLLSCPRVSVSRSTMERGSDTRQTHPCPVFEVVVFHRRSVSYCECVHSVSTCTRHFRDPWIFSLGRRKWPRSIVGSGNRTFLSTSVVQVGPCRLCHVQMSRNTFRVLGPTQSLLS